MNTQKSTRAIDNGLYQLYTDIQLRDVENDVTMSLTEKEQLKTVLISLAEIDGNISYPIFQEIFHNSMRYGTVSDQEPLVAHAPSIEQQVLDTTLTENTTIVQQSHQSQNSTIKHKPRTKGTSKTTRLRPITTRSQTARTEHHLAQTEQSPPSIDDHNQRTEYRAAMNSALLAVDDTPVPQPKTAYKRKQKYTNNATTAIGFNAKPLDEILLHRPRKELQLIKDHPQRSSAVFRARMSTINEPKKATEKAFLEKFDAGDVMQVYKKPMIEFIGLLSHGYHQLHLNKCRQMLCAYQIGKITDQLLRASSQEDKQKLEKRLFRHLNEVLAKNHYNYNSFPGLCINSVYLVEHVGVHALFVPEVISPAILRVMDGHTLLSLAKHLNDEWPPQFKRLARLTNYGEIVVSRSHSDDTTSEGSKAYPGHFLSSI